MCGIAVIFGEKNLALKAYKCFEELVDEAIEHQMYFDAFLSITNLARAHIEFGNFEESTNLLQKLQIIYQKRWI